jgi:hypothetical protein
MKKSKPKGTGKGKKPPAPKQKQKQKQTQNVNVKFNIGRTSRGKGGGTSTANTKIIPSYTSQPISSYIFREEPMQPPIIYQPTHAPAPILSSIQPSIQPLLMPSIENNTPQRLGASATPIPRSTVPRLNRDNISQISAITGIDRWEKTDTIPKPTLNPFPTMASIYSKNLPNEFYENPLRRNPMRDARLYKTESLMNSPNPPFIPKIPRKRTEQQRIRSNQQQNARRAKLRSEKKVDSNPDV